MSNKIFEITHDSLAAKIWDKTSAEERLQIEVRNFIASSLQNYTSRKDFLSKKNIDYISPYINKLKLGAGEEDFIKRSRRFHKRQRIILISFISIVFILLLSALLLTINSQEKTAKSLKALEIEKAERQKLEVDALFRKADAYIAAGINADSVFDKIQNLDNSDSTNQKIHRLKKK